MLKLASSVGQLLKRYSSWTLTQKNVAILMKFFYYLREQRQKNNQQRVRSEREIRPEDLTRATRAIVRVVQKSSYTGEFTDIEELGGAKTSSTLKSLNPILVNGVLRV